MSDVNVSLLRHKLDVSMHTGFSWLGTGAMTSRQSVVRFLDQIKILSKEDALLADMYFSTWMNQVRPIVQFVILP